MNYSIHESLHENLNPILELNWPTSDELIFDAVKKLVVERDTAEAQLAELHDTATLLLNNSAMDTNVLTSVHKLLARPDTTQPQLSEIRYVLHGDIQPCSVLYSDDTTTLLRLDEGDVMCETDTIEWSDSVTYRCQELLKSDSIRKDGLFVKHATPVLAQLVRDERILLNDNGVETFVPTLDERLAETQIAVGISAVER